MAVRRNGISVLRVKIGDCHRYDRLADLNRHELGVVYIADIFLQAIRHQWDKVTAGIVPIFRWWELKRVEILTGEEFGSHGHNQRAGLFSSERIVTSQWDGTMIVLG